MQKYFSRQGIMLIAGLLMVPVVCLLMGFVGMASKGRLHILQAEILQSGALLILGLFAAAIVKILCSNKI